MKPGCRFWKRLRAALENGIDSLPEEGRNHLRVCSSCRRRFYETTMVEMWLRDLAVRYGGEIPPVMDPERVQAGRRRAFPSGRARYALLGGAGVCLALVALLLHRSAPQPVVVAGPGKEVAQVAVARNTLPVPPGVKHAAAGRKKAVARDASGNVKKEENESLEAWLARTVSLLSIPEELQGFFDSPSMEHDETL